MSRYTSQRIKQKSTNAINKTYTDKPIKTQFSDVFLVRKYVLQSGSFLSALRDEMADTIARVPYHSTIHTVKLHKTDINNGNYQDIMLRKIKGKRKRKTPLLL